MDKIRKALDLARLERLQPADGYRAAEPAGPVYPKRNPVGVIVYSRTRVVSSSPELLESHRVVRPTDPGPASAAFGMLRTQVLQRMDAHQWRTLAVFSPSPREGRTTTAINLAIHLANDCDHSVLLVEMDLRRPSIANTFGLSPESGIDDVLEGSADIGDCLYHPDGFERLVLLPARRPLAQSSGALAGPRSRELVAELRARYEDRIVMFDLPPVLTTDDALAFAPFVECGLMVAAEGRTRRADLVRAIELLPKTPMVGTVLNRAADVPDQY